MGDLINFEPHKTNQSEPKIWTCGCGGRTFHLYADGSVRCNQCDEISVIRVFDPDSEKPA